MQVQQFCVALAEGCGSRYRRCQRGLVAATLVLGAVGCSHSEHVINPGPRVIRGSGTVVSESRAVSGLTGISLLAYADVYIEQGAKESLRLEGEDNMLRRMETSVQAGVLTVRTETGVELQPTLPIELYLTVPALALSRFSHSGVGDVEGTDLKFDRLTLVHDGVGEIRLDRLDAVELETSLTGIGEAELSGAVDRQEVSVRGIGDYNAEGLASGVAEVTVVGDRSATVRVSTSLGVKIDGGGTVYYYGDPTVNSTINGTGRVVRIGP